MDSLWFTQACSGNMDISSRQFVFELSMSQTRFPKKLCVSYRRKLLKVAGGGGSLGKKVGNGSRTFH